MTPKRLRTIVLDNSQQGRAGTRVSSEANFPVGSSGFLYRIIIYMQASRWLARHVVVCAQDWKRRVYTQVGVGKNMRPFLAFISMKNSTDILRYFLSLNCPDDAHKEKSVIN